MAHEVESKVAYPTTNCQKVGAKFEEVAEAC